MHSPTHIYTYIIAASRLARQLNCPKLRRRAPPGDSQGTRNRRGSESVEARERPLALDKARKWRRLASESAEDDHPDVELERD